MAGLVTREFRAQLVLATHSVDILNRLHREGAQLVRCDRTAPAPSAQVLESDAALFADLSAWAALTPYTAINFLASRKLLFVEGKTEIALLPIFAALHYRNDPERLRSFRRWAIVGLDGATRANEPALLGRLVAGPAVTDRGRGGVFTVLTVLDRGFERAPGWSAEAEANGVRAATLVWSQHSVESLLVQPATLTVWLRAWLGDGAPADLAARVEAAAAAGPPRATRGARRGARPARPDDARLRAEPARRRWRARSGAAPDAGWLHPPCWVAPRG